MKSIIVALFLCTLSVQASHFVNCLVDAEIVAVKKYNYINATTTFTRYFPVDPGTVSDERSTMLVLQISDVLNLPSQMSCYFKAGQEIMLPVRSDDQESYMSGQKLKLGYRNIGDIRGSSVTWSIL